MRGPHGMPAATSLGPSLQPVIRVVPSGVGLVTAGDGVAGLDQLGADVDAARRFDETQQTVVLIGVGYVAYEPHTLDVGEEPQPVGGLARRSTRRSPANDSDQTHRCRAAGSLDTNCVAVDYLDNRPHGSVR